VRDGDPYGAPSVVLFEKHLFAASFLVLIFSKKVVFSLAKVGKVMMPFHIKTYISFMLNQEEYFSDSVRDDDPYGRRLAWC